MIGDRSSAERARQKLERKALDAVIVNDIARSDIGFDSADNEVTIVTGADEQPVSRGTKAEVARAVLDEVERLRTSAEAGSTVEGDQ